MHVLALDFPQLSKYWEYDLRNYSCYTEPFAVSLYFSLYLDMHVLALDFPQLSKYWEYDLRNYSCYTEPFAVSLYFSLYLDMHGLTFETSVYYW